MSLEGKKKRKKGYAEIVKLHLSRWLYINRPTRNARFCVLKHVIRAQQVGRAVGTYVEICRDISVVGSSQSECRRYAILWH